MKKKPFLGIMALPMLLGLASSLTSCGSNRNNYAYDLDFNEDVSGATVNFWIPFGSEIKGKLGDILDEFTRLTGVTVKCEDKGGYDDLLKATTLAATSGNYPHLVVGYPDHFAAYVKSNIIVRLDYYFENDIHNDTFEPEGEDFEMSDFYADYMVENQSIEFDREGNPYTLGVPFNKSTEVLVYNKSFFDYIAKNEAWKDKIFVPASYEELESVGKNILKYFSDNNLYGTEIKDTDGSLVLDLSELSAPTQASGTKQFKPFSYDSQANLFITAVRQNGGTYTEIDKKTKRGYLAFDSQETRDALTTLKGYYDERVFGIPADWGEAKYGSNPFKACKTVMTLGSSAGVANDATAGNKFKIAAAPVPYLHADKKFVISQGANLALLDRGSRKERLAAWQLMKFLSKYANGWFASQTGYYPSCAYAEKAGPDGTSGMWANYDEEEFEGTDYATWLDEASSSLSTTDRIRAQTAQVNLDTYVNPSEGWTKFVDPPFSGSADIRREVASITPWVFTGTKTPDVAIKDIYSTLSDYVRK